MIAEKLRSRIAALDQIISTLIARHHKHSNINKHICLVIFSAQHLKEPFYNGVAIMSVIILPSDHICHLLLQEISDGYENILW